MDRTIQRGGTQLVYAVHQTLPFFQKWVWLARLHTHTYASLGRRRREKGMRREKEGEEGEEGGGGRRMERREKD